MFNFLISTANAQVSLPSLSQTQNLPAFISSIYSFALTIVGLAVFVQIIRAGFSWLTAAGSAPKYEKARGRMTNAIIGAILLFAAYLILYVINPDLVKNTFNFSLPKQQSSQTPATPPLALKTDPTPGTGAMAGIPSSLSAGSLISPVARAQEGVYTFTIEVVDADGNTCSKAFNMEIGPNLAPYSLNQPQQPQAGKLSVPVAQAQDDCSVVQIGTQSFPNGTEGVPYFTEIVAAGGRRPYVYSVVEGSSSFLPINEAKAAAGLPPGLSMQATIEMPVLTIENKTANRNPSYAFEQTDTFHLALTNAKPNSTVFFKWQKDGSPWFYPGKTPNADGWINFAKTDDKGMWVNDASFTADQVGSWYEWAMVDGKISKAIGFQVLAPKTVIVQSASVTPPPQAYGGGGGAGSFFAQCAPQNQCEDRTTGALSPVLTDQQVAQNEEAYRNLSPAEQKMADNPSDRCPGQRQVSACTYPQQNPSDNCNEYQVQWGNCLDQANQLGGWGQITEQQAAGIPSMDAAKPGSLFEADQTVFDSTTGNGPLKTIPTGQKVVYCRYTDQAAAINCGTPSSGEFCLPGNTIGVNSNFCAPTPASAYQHL